MVYTGESVTVAIPEKSRARYESAYIKFEKWFEVNNLQQFNEEVLLAYFGEKAKVQKSSSLWALYSILRVVLYLRKNVNIAKYSNLIAFLKKKSVGYHQAPKSKGLSKEDLARFLKEADDKEFLLMKVVSIIGEAGSCNRHELTHLLVNQVKDEGHCFRITMPNSQYSLQREFIVLGKTEDEINLAEIIRKYINLRPQKSINERFFVTYKSGKCSSQPVGINMIAIIPKKVASFLGLPDPDSYTCFRLGKSCRGIK